MRFDKDEKRLKAIKFKFNIFTTKCDCCKNEFKGERMWQFNRYGCNETVHKWYYCKRCMKSAEDVLNEIDTDEVPYGIAGVDKFSSFVKKDYTRMNSKNQ